MRMMNEGEVKVFFEALNEMLDKPDTTRLSRARFMIQEAQDRMTDDSLITAWRRLAIAWERVALR